MRFRLKLVALFLFCAFTASFTMQSTRDQEPSMSPDSFQELTVARQQSEIAEEVGRWYQAASVTTVPSLPTKESEHAAHFDPGSVEQLIVDIFGPAAPEALHVAKCESGYRADATNGRYRGVFQVGDMHASEWFEVVGRDYWSSWMDPLANITYAHTLWSRSGWGPWQCAA